MKPRHLELFREISEACGVSGHSTEVANIFLREAERLGLQCGMDDIGSVSAMVPSSSPAGVQNKKTRSNVLITAHIDNVGYVVFEIDKEKRELKLAKVGLPFLKGKYHCVLRSGVEHREVLVEDEGEEEYYFAKAEVIDNDIDMDSISIGDVIYYNNPVVNKPRGKFTGAFMDNKASIMSMIMAMEEVVAAGTNQHNLFFVLTSFEEIGAYGSMTAAQKIKPRFAINLDVFPVDTRREVSSGVIISCGYIYNPVLVKYTVDLAEKYNVPHLVRVPAPDGESDANYIIKQNGGTPVCEIGAPCVNVHFPEEMVSKKGIVSTAKLLTHMCINTYKITSLVPGGNYGL